MPAKSSVTETALPPPALKRAAGGATALTSSLDPMFPHACDTQRWQSPAVGTVLRDLDPSQIETVTAPFGGGDVTDKHQRATGYRASEDFANRRSWGSL